MRTFIFTCLLCFSLGGSYAQLVENGDSIEQDTIWVNCGIGDNIEFNKGTLKMAIFKSIIPPDVPNMNVVIESSRGTKLKSKEFAIDGLDIYLPLTTIEDKYWSITINKGKEVYKVRRVTMR